jgi:hypothetical protein
MRHRVNLLVGILLMSTSTAAHAQGGEDRKPNWGVGIEGGVMAFGKWEDIDPVLVVEPWFAPGATRRQNAHAQTISASRSAFSLSAMDDHCGNVPPPQDCIPRIIVKFPFEWRPGGDPPDYWAWRDLGKLEVGPSVSLIPSLSFRLGRFGGVGSALVAGGGIFYQAGRKTEIQGTGTLTTESLVAPAAAVGLALDRAFSRRVALILNVRGYAVFAGDMKIVTPTGPVVLGAGERPMFSQSITAGVSLSR